MDIEEVKKAFKNKTPVMVKHILLGDIFRERITAVIYRLKNGETDISVETKDAFCDSVIISNLSDIRHATVEEINDYYKRRKNAEPSLLQELQPIRTVYKTVKNMSISEMAEFFNNAEESIMTPSCSAEFCDGYSTDGLCTEHNCIEAMLKWLKSEVK